jgi:transcriptional regulator with XRE-family HTH domain
MDVSQLIRLRLSELGLDQKELADAAQVTESYISQLLAGRKTPPAPSRTDIYEKIARFLKLPSGDLSQLAEAQRRLERKKKVADPPCPLFKDFRELILRKCHPDRNAEVKRIFERDAFGELERLVTQTILEVAQVVAREELRSETWLRGIAEVSGLSFEQMRVAVLDFLEADVLHISGEGCVSFLDPMISTWDIDLKTFRIEIALNPRLAPGTIKQFEFVEVTAPQQSAQEPALAEFLRDKSLSAGVTAEEIDFLRTLKFKGRKPSLLYYYREVQNLRDPLNFNP